MVALVYFKKRIVFPPCPKAVDFEIFGLSNGRALSEERKVDGKHDSEAREQ